MTLTLHLAKNTIALAAHAALEESGADYALHWVDFSKAEQQSDAYLTLNPKGRVPTLITPSGPLTEVVAIMEWVAATQAPSLMPTDPWQAAKAREMMLFLAATMHVNHAHKMRGHRWADDTDAHSAMTAKVTENMGANATYIDGLLTGDWVCQTFSIADLHLWTICRWLDGDGVDIAATPKLAAHFDRVAARPAVARVAALHSA